MNNALAAVVCGMPFSGTTYLSRLICAHPLIDSGFECGLLFGDSPSQFPESGRYYRWMMDLKPPYNWKLTQRQLDDVCQAKDFAEAYQRIVAHCHLFSAQTPFVLDKTPSYVYKLDDVMRKVPDVPFIVVRKEKLNQYYSFTKRDHTLDFFQDRYLKSVRAIRRCRNDAELRDRLLVLPFEKLLSDQGKSYRKVINFINRFNPQIEFDKSQIQTLADSLKADIDGKKKLRRKYSYEDEKAKMLKTLSADDIATVNEMVDDVPINIGF